MSLAMILGAWLAGSLLLGLLLGCVFRAFARRRHAEEEVFGGLDDVEAMAELRRRASRCREEFKDSVQLALLMSSLPAQGEIQASFRLATTQRGRMIQ